MSAATITPRMTVEEFLLRPDREDGLQEELIDGVIYLSPNVMPDHTDACGNLIQLLAPLERQGFRVLPETAFRLTPYSLPNTDATVVSRAEWAAAKKAKQYPRQAPVLAIEVHSPRNGKTAMLQKVALDLEHRSEQCWVVYPKERKVTIFHPDQSSIEKRAGDTLSFYDCTFSVTNVFAD